MDLQRTQQWLSIHIMDSGERRRVPLSLNIPSRSSPVSSSDSDCSSTYSGKPLPPISNIPGLNYDYATSNYREPVRRRARSSAGGETEYLKLVREGGRKDLLHYKEFDPGETKPRRRSRAEDSIFYQPVKQEVHGIKKPPVKYERSRRDSTSSSDASPSCEQKKTKALTKMPRRISPQDHNILEYREYQPSSNSITVPKDSVLYTSDEGTPWKSDESDREDHIMSHGHSSLKSVHMKKGFPLKSLPSTKSKVIPSCRKITIPKVQAGSRLLNSGKPIRVG